MQLIRSQSNLAEEPSPAFYPGRKLSEVEQALLWSVLQEDPECPSRVLLDKISQRQITIVSTAGGSLGGSIVTRAARVTLGGIGLLPLAQRSSGSRPMWRVSGCICLPIGSTNTMPLARWWPS